MTIEFSLRRRARRARYMATLWLGLATFILVGTYASLPVIANRAVRTFVNLEQNATQAAGDRKGSNIELYVIGVVALALLAVGFAGFLLGRTAFVEIELAARFGGLADALCISGESLDQLEKAANIFVPGSKYLSVPEIFSTKDFDSVAGAVKALTGK
jgi:hypothetical protein